MSVFHVFQLYKYYLIAQSITYENILQLSKDWVKWD